MSAAVPARTVALAPAGPVTGRVRAPASKSVTNRLLPIAALADGVSVLTVPLDSDDSQAMRRAVTALGATVRDETDASGRTRWVVGGTAGRLRAPRAPVDAGLSGTCLRFVAALAPLADGRVTVDGAPPLRRRPVGALTAALARLGADITDTGGYPPVHAHGGGLAGGEVTVDVTASSQFASAVLLAAPYARADVRLRLAGEAAVDYVALTADTVARWGAGVVELEDGWRVAGGHGYRAREVEVEHDASAAAHLLALAAATAGRVTVVNAAGTRQPDARLPGHLAAMGCAVERRGDALTVSGPARLAPLRADLGDMPDQVTTLAALAALADGESELTGVAVARGHETDRLAALAIELGKLGVAVLERPDGLVIGGGLVAQRPAGAAPVRLATHDDHRLAMAFAALGAAVPGVVVEEPWCVSKTYPAFWQDAAALGVQWQEIE